MGLVPKTTKSEVKFFAGLTISKIIGIFIFGGLGILLGSFLPAILQILLSVVLVILFLIATSKSPSNPKIPFIQGLKQWIAFCLRKKHFYGTETDEYIDLERRESDRERKKAKKAKKNKQD